MKTIGTYALWVGLFVAVSLAAHAQLVLNQPNTTGTYTAPTSITLSPGFSSTGNFHAFITALLGNAASSNQTYVQRTAYLKSFGGTPPAATSLTVERAMRDITYYAGLGRHTQAKQTV